MCVGGGESFRVRLSEQRALISMCNDELLMVVFCLTLAHSREVLKHMPEAISSTRAALTKIICGYFD